MYSLYLIIRCFYLYVQTTQGETIYNREYCPLCLNEFAAPIRANCGHAFCIECLHSCFTGNPTEHNCPMCRNPIHDFECLNKFTLEGKEQARERQLEEELRNYIPQQNISEETRTDLQEIPLLMFTYYVIACFTNCLVQFILSFN